jgi:ATP synthase protein I
LIPPLKTKPIRTVLKWQLIATAVIAAIAGLWDGGHAALSAVLGGAINVLAGVVYALLLGVGEPRPASIERTLTALFRAEGAKILLIIAGLWLTLSLYKDMVPLAFFSAFIVTVVVFSMAILVRDK